MKVAFLDRDGVINKKIENGYVLKWEEFEFLPGIVGAIKFLNQNNIPVIVISNQACVGKGLVDRQGIDNINKRMIKELADRGAKILDVFYCPHKPEDNCDCRKPKTGLFLQAKKKYPDIDLKGSFFIGDSESDMIAGRSIDCRTHLFRLGDDIQDIIKQVIQGT